MMEKAAYDFHETKKSEMNSYLYLVGILIAGFAVYYYLIRDKIFDVSSDVSHSVMQDMFAGSSISAPPAPSTIEIRQAPLYEPRTTTASGPHSPSQEAPSQDVTIHAEPHATDPYHENQESSDIPENLRHPERSFRPPPLNNETSLAVQSGTASNTTHVPFDNPQKFQTETISGGGEFMPGIFANDTFHDTSFSSF